MGAFKAIIEIWGSLDLLGKVVVIGLAAISVYKWSLVASKYAYFKHISAGDQRIYERFMKFKPLIRQDYIQAFRDVPSNSNLPLYKIYQVCQIELLNPEKIDVDDVDATSEVLDASMGEQIIELERGLDFLSVIATIAPFLGLLGTVWGIMVSFRKMTQSGSATISTVAPGISVALITTVAGLLVAIPAAIYFSYFRRKVNNELVLMEKFGKQMLSNIRRLVKNGD